MKCEEACVCVCVCVCFKSSAAKQSSIMSCDKRSQDCIMKSGEPQLQTNQVLYVLCSWLLRFLGLKHNDIYNLEKAWLAKCKRAHQSSPSDSFPEISLSSSSSAPFGLLGFGFGAGFGFGGVGLPPGGGADFAFAFAFGAGGTGLPEKTLAHLPS